MTLRLSGKNLDIGEALRQHVAGRGEAAGAFDGFADGNMPATGKRFGRRRFDRAADKIERRLSKPISAVSAVARLDLRAPPRRIQPADSRATNVVCRLLGRMIGRLRPKAPRDSKGAA